MTRIFCWLFGHRWRASHQQTIANVPGHWYECRRCDAVCWSADTGDVQTDHHVEARG